MGVGRRARDNRREALGIPSSVHERNKATIGMHHGLFNYPVAPPLSPPHFLLRFSVPLRLFCLLLLFSDGAIKMFPRSLLSRG